MRPGIDGRPEQGAAECGVGIEAQVGRGFGCVFQLLYGPFGAGFGIVVYGFWCKAIEQGIIGGVYGYQLALQMRGKLGDLKAGFFYDAFDLVCVSLAFRGFLQVDDAGVPTGDLDADVTEVGGPFADGR